MTIRYSPRDERMRRLIAQEAARLMEEEGIADHYAAKRKAAERLGAPETRNLPRNIEVEEARSEFQRIFQADVIPKRLRTLREVALQAMKLLARFQPRLIGSVLSGVAGIYSDIELHLFAETPEEVSLFLDEHRIPYEQEERRLRVGRDSYRNFPGYGFRAGEWTIELTIFPTEGLRQAPLNPVNGQPERRANITAVHELLGLIP